jgi:hypothetical protein
MSYSVLRPLASIIFNSQPSAITEHPTMIPMITLTLAHVPVLSITLCLVHARVIADLSFFASSIIVRSRLRVSSRGAVFEKDGCEKGDEEEETMCACVSAENILGAWTIKEKDKRESEHK